jgi:acetyl/propionyl-CoA carboxylase alpha subunit/acetyl-CoA carboxylase carboxyltransferase component
VKSLSRLAILDRGVGAMRMIRATRELSLEGTAVRTVAFFTDADRSALFVREADEAVNLGPLDGYFERLEPALRGASVDGVWAGWGPLSGHVGLAAMCERLGIVLVDGKAKAIPTGAPAPAEGRRVVAVQIVGDGRGTAWALGVRARSGGRALLEESSCPALSPEMERETREVATRLFREAALAGAAVAEFDCSSGIGHPVLKGVRVGLDGAHAITELVTGLDLVRLQLQIAMGGRLDGEPPPEVGHAMGASLLAECARPGVVELLRLPAGPGVRVDSGVAEGDIVDAGPGLDPAFATIAVWGQDRGRARSRLRRALSEVAVVIRGGGTNKTLLLQALDSKQLAGRDADVALLQAALEAHDEEVELDRARFFASASRGRPLVTDGSGKPVELRHRAHTYRFRVHRLDPARYRIAIGERTVDVRADRRGRYEGRLECGPHRFRIVSAADGPDHLVEVDGIAHRISRDDGGLVRAPAPAVVVATRVHPGDRIVEGDALIVLEAMKMETSIAAPFGGLVRQVLASANEQVDLGAPLIRIAADREHETGDGEPAVSFERLATPLTADVDARKECERALAALRSLLLGYDDPVAAAGRVGSDWSAVCRNASFEHDEIRRGEDEILDIFADLCSMAGRRPVVQEPAAEEVHDGQEELLIYLRALDPRQDSLSSTFVDGLRRALARYGVRSLERTAELEEAVFRMMRGLHRLEAVAPSIASILDRRLERSGAQTAGESPEFRALLDRIVTATEDRMPALTDLAREARYRFFDQPHVERARDLVYREMEEQLAYLELHPLAEDRSRRLMAIVDCPQPMKGQVVREFEDAGPEKRLVMLEVLARRYYRIRDLEGGRTDDAEGHSFFTAWYDHEGARVHLIATYAPYEELGGAAGAAARMLGGIPAGDDVVIDLYSWRGGHTWDAEATSREIAQVLDGTPFGRRIRRVVVAMSGSDHGLGAAALEHFTYRPTEEGYREEKLYRGLHPMMGKRLELWRLSNFRIDRLASVEDVYLFRGVAKENPKDERLFALAEVRDLTPVRDGSGRAVALPHLERMLTEALAGIRLFQSHRPPGKRLQWNRVLLYLWPPLELETTELYEIVHKLAPLTEGLGLEKVVVRGWMPDPTTGELREQVLHISNPAGRGLAMRFDRPSDRPIRTLSEYMQKVVQTRQRGLIYPYEIVRMLTPDPRTQADFPQGEFVEHDLDASGELVPVSRPHGQNSANLVVGVIRNITPAYPEGMTRVILLGDPSRSLGSLAEPECGRIVAAIDLAEQLGVPLEWYAVSAGAKISMESGTENMDWIGRVLRRLIEYTQAGGEVNVIVVGINVGAQPYWNAEATMLMHTRGILIMTPDSAMVLTGKQALDYSGGVSADGNLGIGGYDRIMGPNGQAQYWARDIDEACHVLLRHYDHTYVLPGERFPRRVPTSDPFDRDVRDAPHHGNGSGFDLIGEITSEVTNPGRKKPFDIRSVMRAVADRDHLPLERWPGMRDAEMAVVWDAHLGGFPVCLIGIESRPLPRYGLVPADGPDHWTAGTLFPRSSKKIARAINAATGNRPLVVLANLSGFDGSPESLRELQLEYGAEIGRAVTNFEGPMVFCVVSRYHGGAFVVFSATLNEGLEIAAIEGSFASVIGGAPAAAVVFSRDVDARTKADARVRDAEEALASAEGPEKGRLRARLDEVSTAVRSQKLGEVAEEFDRTHDIYRAQRMGSVKHIIPASGLRPYLIDAVDRGVRREIERLSPAMASR